MKINVVHIITTIDLGGAEKQVLTLASKQREEGYNVKLIFLKDEPRLLNNFLAAGIEVNSEFSHLGLFRQVFQLRSISNSKDTVFHAHLPRAELLCALSLKAKSFVVTRHNAESFFPDAPKIISKLLSRLVLGRAFACISISHTVDKFLRETQEIGAQTKKLVIYYGLESRALLGNRKKQIELNKLRLGTISRLVKQKNIPLLLLTLQQLNRNGEFSADLSIIGVGSLLDELKQISTSLGLENSVSWLGHVHDIGNFFSTLDFFVLSSNYEGFGLVLLEAMGQGVPIVARKVSAIPEVLGTNHPGLVDSVDPQEFASRIVLMAKNRELVEKCIDLQFTRLKDFSIDKAVNAHEDLYKELLLNGA